MARIVTSSENHSQNDIKQSEVVVVMVPFPAQGHLNQLHLSRLVLSYNIPIYYLGFSTNISQAKDRVHGWDPLTTPNIHFQEFPTPSSYYAIPPCSDHNSSEASSKVIVSVLDASLELREPLHVLANNTKCLHLPAFLGKFIERLLLPSGAEFFHGLPSLQNSFTPEFLDFVGRQYNKHSSFCSGNLYDTRKVVEGPYLEVLAKFHRLLRRGKQWAIGSFNPATVPESKPSNNPRHKCLKWLGKQEANLVLLVSFGTTGSLSTEQIKELAIGLEKS
nr:zeatin O-xylosyltransferase-like [Nicotiana tomentosiformis]